MFIKDPYKDNVQIIKNDEYLDYSDYNITMGGERYIIPDFLPGMGPGPVQPPKPPNPPKPINPNQGQPPSKPQNPGNSHFGPGPYIPPKPSGPTMPPSKPPGPPAPPKPPGLPIAPGPVIPPATPLPINNYNMRRCIYKYTYVWLKNGNSFWFWPVSVNGQSARGYRWNKRRWILDTINLSQIFTYKCFGRFADKKEDSLAGTIKTQSISPDRINLEYPYISGNENDNIENVINDELINAYNDLLLKEVFVPVDTNFTTITSAYEVPLDTKGILSLVMSLYTKISGEERGRTEFSSITLNINNGDVYSLDDLFDADLDYRKELSSIAIEKANQQKLDFIAPYKGITDNQKYYLTPEELVLYYQVDEFTTYKDGLFRISIPYTEIENLLADNSPIKKLLNN